ncbi:MAG: ImmA/IrrE family metallo-endopeptidase [Clostridiales bacterium]|nr:ImmA/IrrE family metallo-endopeptidase [Clostridiales bacterium]
MDVYGVYKGVRNAAWQCLIDHKITALPVDLIRIAAESGVVIRKNSDVHELYGRESGACILHNGQWYLIYDDACVVGRRRFTIAHELGHIFLGHELINGRHGRSFDARNPQSETDADVFASRLLAPACVLWALDIRTADEISKVCGISDAAAKIRANRMRVLYDRQKFLTSPLERRVLEQFKAFILKNK